MGTLNILVIYDRWEEPEEQGAAAAPDKAPLTRTLDKKEVEDEVAEALGKLGHEATLHVLDGSLKSLHALSRSDCDLVFNLAESFAGNDTADYCIAAYLELIDKRFTGSGSHGLLYAQDKAVAKKILEFHGIHTPVFARSYPRPARLLPRPGVPGHRQAGARGRLHRHRVQCRGVVDPRADGAHRLAARELRFAGADRGVRRGAEMYVGVIGNENPPALPVVELDLSKLPEGRPKIAGAEVKWAKGTGAYRDTKSTVAGRFVRRDRDAAPETALAAFQALELRDYARIDMRLRPDGRVAVIEANPNPWLASKAEFAMAARKAGRNYTQLVEEIVDLSPWRDTAADERPRTLRTRTGFPSALPQIERRLVARRRREPVDLVGRPRRSHAERVRHDPRAGFELLGKDWAQPLVERRQQVERDDGCLGDVGLEDVLLAEIDEALDACCLRIRP